jgi:hypothetical protein
MSHTRFDCSHHNLYSYTQQQHHFVHVAHQVDYLAMLAEFRPTEPTALGSLNVACTVESVGDKHKITLNVQSGKNLVAMDKRGTSDPFVVVTIYGGTMSDTKRGETKVQRKTLNPTWNEVLHFEIEATTLDRCSLTLFFTHLIFPRSLCCPLPFFIYIDVTGVA